MAAFHYFWIFFSFKKKYQALVPDCKYNLTNSGKNYINNDMLIKAKDISIGNKELVKFLKSLDPAAYVDYCFKSKLKPPDKGNLSKIWMKAGNHTSQELNLFRHRHPHWRAQIDKNSTERNTKRNKKYTFFDKKHPQNRKWSKKEMEEFFKLTKTKKDYELAEYFKRSVPSIQYLRRKYKDRRGARLPLSPYNEGGR